MSYSVNVQVLLDRAASRATDPANTANRLTKHVSQLATLAAHAAVPARKGGNPLMSRAQGDVCHAGGWTDAEIQAFCARRDRLLRWGRTEQEADDLAERLTLRDRDGDDRKLCQECAHGIRGLRCAKNHAFQATQLQRCPAFAQSEISRQEAPSDVPQGSTVLTLTPPCRRTASRDAP